MVTSRSNPEVCVGIEPDPVSRRIENRFRQLLEAAPDAILEVDAEGRITLANVAAETMFGYTRPELVGQSIEILVPQNKRSVHARDRAGYAENPKVRPMGPGLELEAQRKDGTLLPVEISLSPNHSGESSNVIAIVRDVSQRHYMELMLRRSEERLRQAEKLEALGRLAGGVAHEFNNLLSMVLGYSELLLPVVPEGARHYVEKITASAKRAAALTRQMLAFGHRQMLEPRVLDLNTVVIESCRIASRLLGENVETIVLPALEPAWIKVDPTQIDQIMANLASNAQAAMPQGGKLTISVSGTKVGENNIVEHPGVPPGDYVVLSVSDTGSGMAPEVQARLFEPFFTTREFGQGLGMGLPSMYGMVVQSGGSVSVHSEPGVGTTFQIYLPSVQPEEEPGPLAAKLQGAEYLRGNETILLVEDQASLLDLSREFLERLGYRVLTAALPEKATQISREFPGTIDMLLTDILMPGMNGRELGYRLREERPEMKVLYVSGFADRVFEHSGGPDVDEGFMEKPYSFDELARKIREML
jgi:PAS domain S-box-containing protein